MQCVTTGAIAAGATATGLRAWLHLHRPGWATPHRMKAATAVVLVFGVLAAGVSASPSTPSPSGADAQQSPPAGSVRVSP